LSSNLLASFGIGSLFDTGLYRAAPLRELVDRFVTPQLIDAVAMESKTGRLLLIVTTNLDIGEAVVWNMGAIAETGGEQARGLFRNILIASSSVPGVFPPVMIRVEHGGRAYEEMHADGGATIPFFVAAASPFVAPEQGPDRDVFVIVNGTLSAPQQTTRRNTVAIALQGFTALLYQTFRSELLRLQTLVEANGSTFRYTAIPRIYPYGGTLDFNREDMRRLFNYGTACATAGELWIAASTTRTVANEPPHDACPANNSAAVFASKP
jgi:predicted acylesterase/phospholipase RssA